MAERVTAERNLTAGKRQAFGIFLENLPVLPLQREFGAAPD